MESSQSGCLAVEPAEEFKRAQECILHHVLRVVPFRVNQRARDLRGIQGA
jgi:hypothetical protein